MDQLGAAAKGRAALHEAEPQQLLDRLEQLVAMPNDRTTYHAGGQDQRGLVELQNIKLRWKGMLY